jgi:hypothetical protein
MIVQVRFIAFPLSASRALQPRPLIIALGRRRLQAVVAPLPDERAEFPRTTKYRDDFQNALRSQ